MNQNIVLDLQPIMLNSQMANFGPWSTKLKNHTRRTLGKIANCLDTLEYPYYMLEGVKNNKNKSEIELPLKKSRKNKKVDAQQQDDTQSVQNEASVENNNNYVPEIVLTDQELLNLRMEFINNQDKLYQLILDYIPENMARVVQMKMSKRQDSNNFIALFITVKEVYDSLVGGNAEQQIKSNLKSLLDLSYSNGDISDHLENFKSYAENLVKLNQFDCVDNMTLISFLLDSIKVVAYQEHVKSMRMNNTIPTTFDDVSMDVYNFFYTKSMNENTSNSKTLANNNNENNNIMYANKRTQKSIESSEYNCLYHGSNNKSHNTDDCFVVQELVKREKETPTIQKQSRKKLIVKEKPKLKEATFLMIKKSLMLKNMKKSLVMDSGANVNVCNDSSLLSNIFNLETEFVGANGKSFKSYKAGNIDLLGLFHYILNSPENLISLSKLTKTHEVIFKDNKYIVKSNQSSDYIEFTFDSQSELYRHYLKDDNSLNVIKAKADNVEINNNNNDQPSTVLLNTKNVTKEQRQKSIDKVMQCHCKLNHPSISIMKKSCNQGYLEDFNINMEDILIYEQDDTQCEYCIEAKTTNHTSSSPCPETPEYIGHVVEVDLMFIDGDRSNSIYLISVDLFSKYVIIIHLKTKTARDITDGIIEINRRYNNNGHTIKFIISDNEKGIRSNYNHLSLPTGINILHTVPDNHCHTVERMIRTTKEKFRAVTLSLPYVFPNIYYKYIISQLVKSYNGLCNTINDQSPDHMFFGQLHKSNIHVSIGSIVFARISNSQNDPDMNPRAVECIALGTADTNPKAINVVQLSVYDDINHVREVETYELKTKNTYDNAIAIYKTNNKVVTHQVLSRNIRNNNSNTMANNNNNTNNTNTNISSNTATIPIITTPIPIVANNSNNTLNNNNNSSNNNIDPSNNNNNVTITTTNNNSNIDSNNNNVTTNSNNNIITHNHNTRSKSMKKVYHISIGKAMKKNPQATKLGIRDEMSNMIKNKAFHPIHASKEIKYNSLRSFTFIREKKDANGEDFMKARMVAMGNEEKIDSNEVIYAPTVDVKTIFTVIASTQKKEFKYCVWDVNSAFLKASLEKDIYMRISKDNVEELLKLTNTPSNWKEFVQNDGSMIVKLDKAVYGLKEAPMLWNRRITELLLKNGFIKSVDDECLFTKSDNTGKIHICLHVDDLFVAASSQSLSDSTKLKLESEFGKLKEQSSNKITYLGITIVRDNNGTYLSQNDFIKKLIADYKIINTETLSCNDNLYQDCGEAINVTQFKSLVAKLMFLATRTRYDILFPVSFLATKCSKPLQSNWNSLLHILKYLNRTRDVTLNFNQLSDCSIQVVADASHNLHVDGKGHTGYTLFLGDFEACIYSRSIKQRIITPSSYDSELVSLDEATKSVEKVYNIMKFIGLNPKITLYTDNKPAITTLSDENACTKRSKSINHRIQCTKAKIQEYHMIMEYCETDLNTADVLTKVLPSKKFMQHAQDILRMSLL